MMASEQHPDHAVPPDGPFNGLAVLRPEARDPERQERENRAAKKIAQVVKEQRGKEEEPQPVATEPEDAE